MQDCFLHLIREDLLAFEPYRSAGGERILGNLWLNANESPWDNYPIDNQYCNLNRYPSPQPQLLKNKMAEFYGVEAEHILITRGSDEAIDLLIRLFCRPQLDSILICPPTFGMYAVHAKVHGARVTAIPLLKEHHFQFDRNNITNESSQNIKLIFLCSPNNPTGTILNDEDVLKLCKELLGKCIVVVDEAYIEYANKDSLIQYIHQYGNLVILRTLSKSFGLAGIRCGSLLANKELIAWVKKIIAPYPLSTLTENIAVRAFEVNNLERMHTEIAIIREQRWKLYQHFLMNPAITAVWPSETNFIFCEVANSQAFVNFYLNHGINIRRIDDQYGLTNTVCIGIGQPHENDRVIELLEKFISLKPDHHPPEKSCL